MDEGSLHMHLVFIPVVHTKDKKRNFIDKIACSEFWKVKDSYRQLQDAFYSYMIANNFELEQEFQDKEFDIEYKYKNKIKSLEKENNHLRKIIDKFYETVEKFIDWICHKFGIGESKELIKDFQEETHTFIDPAKQIENEEREKEWDLEL